MKQKKLKIKLTQQKINNNKIDATRVLFYFNPILLYFNFRKKNTFLLK